VPGTGQVQRDRAPDPPRCTGDESDSWLGQ
jgi:hypothetical protein